MKEEVNGQVRYLQNIVDVFDKVAEQAVENYQRTFAVSDTAESDAPKITETVQSNTKSIKEETSNEKNGGQGSRGETVRKDNGRTVRPSSGAGEGTSRLLDEVQAEDVQRAGRQGDASKTPKQRGRQTDRLGDRADTSAGSRGSAGSSEVGDLRRDDVVDKAEKEEKDKSLKKVVEEQIAQKSTQTPKGSNFVISDSLSLPQGEKARFRANMEAIKLVKKLEAENRFATPAEQEELDKKRERFNEVMEILNPPEEQPIAEDEDEQCDYGDRPVKKKRKKQTTYDEYESNYMSWARGSAKVGTTKILPRYDYRAKKLKYHYYEKTADGCVELSYEQYCERENNDATETYRRSTSEISEAPNIVRSSGATGRGNSDGDRYTTESGSVYRQTVGEELRSDTGRSVSTVDRSVHGGREVIDDEQYQQRTDTLTDRRAFKLSPTVRGVVV